MVAGEHNVADASSVAVGERILLSLALPTLKGLIEWRSNGDDGWRNCGIQISIVGPEIETDDG
jgi:hypothetical protein